MSNLFFNIMEHIMEKRAKKILLDLSSKEVE